MKKILAILAIAMLISGVAYAAAVDIDKNVTLVFEVQGDWGFYVSNTALDLGIITVGGTGQDQALVRASSYIPDQNFDIKIQGLGLSDGVNTLVMEDYISIAAILPDPPKGTSTYETVKPIPVTALTTIYTPNAIAPGASHGTHEFNLAVLADTAGLAAGPYDGSILLRMDDLI